MNPRIEKMREEYAKNENKIASLQARNKSLKAKITDLENNDIIGLIRSSGISPDDLAELLTKPDNTKTHFKDLEEDDNETEN